MTLAELYEMQCDLKTKDDIVQIDKKILNCLLNLAIGFKTIK